jgi:hypothetical protein
MQGQKVGGKPDFTLDIAALKIRGMVQALEKGQAAADELREARVRIAGLQQREAKAQREKAEAQREKAEAQRQLEALKLQLAKS